jgi:hypothetical protein
MQRLLAISAICVASTLHAAAQEAKVRAVVELYTSQGCSSCPPADKLMAELARDPGLIVLTFPVDYWDYLGWKDTLAHPHFSYRQRAYSAMRGDRKVYTPQAVVNGVAHAVGSDRSQIERAAAESRAVFGVLTTEIRIRRNGDGLAVTCPPRGADAGPAHLWAMPVVRERSVQIGRGENSGRSVSYVNVVRNVSRIGECGAAAAEVSVPAASLSEDAEGLVVLMQGGNEKKPGAIIAAARFWTR